MNNPKFLVLLEEWELAKTKLISARAKESVLRQQVVDASPMLTSDGERATRERLPDGRQLVAKNSYNIRVKSSTEDFYRFLDKTPSEYRKAVRIKYEINKDEFRELPEAIQDTFKPHLAISQAKTQLTFEELPPTGAHKKPGLKRMFGV